MTMKMNPQVKFTEEEKRLQKIEEDKSFYYHYKSKHRELDLEIAKNVNKWTLTMIQSKKKELKEIYRSVKKYGKRMLNHGFEVEF